MIANKIVEIARQTNLHTKIVELLVSRGFNSVEDITLFLNINVNTLNAVLEYDIFKNVVKTIEECLTNGYKVILYGDADMDGIASISIMYKAISCTNANIEIILTEKAYSSYGINLKLFSDRVDNKTLLIFLDVGTSDIIDLRELKRKTACEIVVIDHHESLSNIIEDIVILNPKCVSIEILSSLTSSSLSALVAVGLLSNANKIEVEKEKLVLELFELATLGIIADMGKLIGINRTIVKLGLKSLSNPVNISLRYLLKNEVKLFNDISVSFLAFKIIPRLNACCRMGFPRLAFDFLTEKNIEKIKKYSELLTQYNDIRRKEEQKILDSIKEFDENYVVIYKENWHPGMLSSVATKIAMNNLKPTIVMTKVKDCWKGSARFPNGNMLEILEELSGNLIKFGGHKEACGFELHSKNLKNFLYKLDNIMKTIKVPSNIPKPEIEIDIDDIDINLLNSLKKLEPFGMGNPIPIFRLAKVNIYSIDDNDDNITIFLYNNAKILKGIAPKRLKNKLPSSQTLESVICKICYTNFNENFVENELYLDILDF